MIGRSSFLAASLLLHSLPAAAQLSDDSAEMQHFFPLFVDGGGFRSWLLLSNAAGADNRCMLDLRGAGLDAGVFEAGPALSPAGSSVDIALPADAGAVLAGRGEQPLAFGYAQLECAGPVVARLLLTAGEDGAINGMTVLESEPQAAAFRFPVLPRFGPLGLVVSNAGSSAAACAVELEGNPGGGIDIAAQSAQVRFFDELFAIPADFDGGSAMLTCGSAVSMAVLQLSGGAFAAMPPAVQAYIAGRANVPDAALRTALAAALGRDDAGDAPELTTEELENLLVLNVEGRGIVSLAGLESAVKLQDLYLGDNEISDISPLAELANLRSMGLPGNRISDISALTGLTGLTWLELGGNDISDISALVGLTDLNTLSLLDNEISDISALSALTGLNYLSLGVNGISDISALAGLINLETLWMPRNEISDVSALSGLTRLKRLSFRANAVSDISALAGLIDLEVLLISDNSISDISALSEMGNLSFLLLQDNDIENIAALVALTSLTEVQLSGNPLDDESVNTHIPALRERGVTIVYP